MLTPLLAKLRINYPTSKIVLLTNPLFLPIYKTKPYNIDAVPYQPESLRSLSNLVSVRGFDLALIPGDNRYSWLARALGARCIIGLSEEKKSWKTFQLDEIIQFSKSPKTLSEIFESLIPGKSPMPYDVNQWPLSIASPLAEKSNYCVLHLSARNKLREWDVDNWKLLADSLRKKGLSVIWSLAPKREPPESLPTQDTLIKGSYSLDELRSLFSNARLIITVETGIAHLCRTTGTPSVVIYGQGNPEIHGYEPFWEHASPMKAAFKENIKCRDQHRLFGRSVSWAKRCERTPHECADPFCISGITSHEVFELVDELIQ